MLVAIRAFLLLLVAIDYTEKVRNGKVVVVEGSIKPGESEVLNSHPASLVVYLQDGVLEFKSDGGMPHIVNPRRGGVVFREALRHVVKNVGSSEIRTVRIDFLRAPQAAPWGTVGLSPNYELLFDNQYARVYEIRIPAGSKEPRHTHKDRVVICLSGAQLEHILPDGRTEVSSLKTGEVAWRRGGTHIGHNMGKTDLWVIAIEPK